MSDRGILVKNAATVVEKLVFAGNTSDTILNSEKTRLELEYPTYTVTIYNDITASAFADANTP